MSEPRRFLMSVDPDAPGLVGLWREFHGGASFGVGVYRCGRVDDTRVPFDPCRGASVNLRKPRGLEFHVAEINRLDPEFFTRLYLLTREQVVEELGPLLAAQVESAIVTRHRMTVAHLAQQN